MLKPFLQISFYVAIFFGNSFGVVNSENLSLPKVKESVIKKAADFKKKSTKTGKTLRRAVNLFSKQDLAWFALDCTASILCSNFYSIVEKIAPFCLDSEVSVIKKQCLKRFVAWNLFWPLVSEFKDFTFCQKLELEVAASLKKKLYQKALGKEFRFFKEKHDQKISSVASGIVSLPNNLTFLLSNIFFVLKTLKNANNMDRALIISIVASSLLIDAYFEKLNKQKEDATSCSSASIEQAMSKIKTVKSFNAENYEIDRFWQRQRSEQKIASRQWMIQQIHSNLQSGIVFIYQLSKLLQTNSPTVNELVTAFDASYELVRTIQQLKTIPKRIVRNLLNMESLAKDLRILLRPSTIDKPGAKELVVSQGKIELSDLDFCYDQAKGDAKESFDFKTEGTLTIEPGQHIGIVGQSGEGKSTLIKLLLRFEEQKSGTIKFDDQDTKFVTHKSLLSAVGIISQEPDLFEGRTLLENIAYGQEKVKIKDVIAAAKKANIHDFIMTLPKKYKTVLGKDTSLSGGQAQRVAIARVLYKNPKILICDEATSALDSINENEIKKSIAEVSKGRTVITIAHRLSTVKDADKIMVIQKGRIVEFDSPEALLAKENGAYRSIWNAQLGALTECSS